MKNTKILIIIMAIIIILLIAVVAFLLLNNKNTDTSVETSNQNSETTNEVIEETSTLNESKNEVKNVVNTTTKDESKSDDKISDTTKEESIPLTGDISSDWKDYEFSINGKKYKLNVTTYQDLANDGWYVNWADYGYEDGYVLNKGQYTTTTIKLQNDSYKGDYVSVGFKNNSDAACDVKECVICGIDMNSYNVKELDCKGPGNVTIGDTYDDIKEALGEGEINYESDTNKVYKYKEDYTKYVTFTVYTDKGLTDIKLINQ